MSEEDRPLPEPCVITEFACPFNACKNGDPLCRVNAVRMAVRLNALADTDEPQGKWKKDVEAIAQVLGIPFSQFLKEIFACANGFRTRFPQIETSDPCNLCPINEKPCDKPDCVHNPVLPLCLITAQILGRELLSVQTLEDEDAWLAQVYSFAQRLNILPELLEAEARFRKPKNN